MPLKTLSFEIWWAWCSPSKNPTMILQCLQPCFFTLCLYPKAQILVQQPLIMFLQVLRHLLFIELRTTSYRINSNFLNIAQVGLQWSAPYLSLSIPLSPNIPASRKYPQFKKLPGSESYLPPSSLPGTPPTLLMIVVYLKNNHRIWETLPLNQNQSIWSTMQTFPQCFLHFCSFRSLRGRFLEGRD